MPEGGNSRLEAMEVVALKEENIKQMEVVALKGENIKQVMLLSTSLTPLSHDAFNFE